jgi:hypothetical protein
MMARLDTHSNIVSPDDLYELLVNLHDNRTDIESLGVYAKLVLLLANHIGDMEVLREAISLAGARQQGFEPAR